MKAKQDILNCHLAANIDPSVGCLKNGESIAVLARLSFSTWEGNLVVFDK